jgi:hypothetical protein
VSLKTHIKLFRLWFSSSTHCIYLPLNATHALICAAWLPGAHNVMDAFEVPASQQLEVEELLPAFKAASANSLIAWMPLQASPHQSKLPWWAADPTLTICWPVFRL